ncbi:hypothetical protein VN1155_10660 [Helicobacter pylori]|nr:hypothetical protein VN1155_10660 [Helicobacter pylori]
MDLTNLENALNNGDFKEQVYRSLEGICQISNVLDQLDLLKNFSDQDLEIVRKIQAIKSALAGYETSEQKLKAKISALVDSLETTKQELEAHLNMELESARASETQKLNEAGNALKTQLIAELKEAKDNLAQALPKQQEQSVIKFLGYSVYGRQALFVNESDHFMELFELDGIHLQANKSYIVQFNMPYELLTDGIYSDMGEIVLCLKTDSKAWPIINSFYQNKSCNLNTHTNRLCSFYRTTSVFKTPSEPEDYKIAVFARKHKDLWVNVNYTSYSHGFETSYLNKASFKGLAGASFKDLITQSIPTVYKNDRVFYKHSQAIVYEILQ